jgi:hypothetical protein
VVCDKQLLESTRGVFVQIRDLVERGCFLGVEQDVLEGGLDLA